MKLHKETLRTLTTRELGTVGGGDSSGSTTNGSAGTGSCPCTSVGGISLTVDTTIGKKLTSIL